MQCTSWENAIGPRDCAYTGEYAFIINSIQSVSTENVIKTLQCMPSDMDCTRDIIEISSTLLKIRNVSQLSILNFEVLLTAFLSGHNMMVLVKHMNGFVYVKLHTLLQVCIIAIETDVKQMDVYQTSNNDHLVFNYDFLVAMNSNEFIQHTLQVYKHQHKYNTFVQVKHRNNTYMFDCLPYSQHGQCCVTTDYACFLYYLLGATNGTFDDFDEEDRVKAATFCHNIESNVHIVNLRTACQQNTFDIHLKHFVNYTFLQQHYKHIIYLLATITSMNKLKTNYNQSQQVLKKCMNDISGLKQAIIKKKMNSSEIVSQLSLIMNKGYDLTEQITYMRLKLQNMESRSPNESQILNFLGENEELLKFGMDVSTCSGPL